MLAIALISSTSERLALFTACISLLAMLVAIQGEVESDDAGRSLVTASILAGLLWLVAVIVGWTALVIVAVVACALVAVATAVALHGSALLHRGKLLGLRPSGWRVGATVVFTVGLLLFLGAGITFGVLLASGGGGDHRDTVAISSPYRVIGTCVNGSCTVNEWELREGTPLDIACQTKGEPAKAPNGRESRIWDRLGSGWYISDLFVEGTADGHYAPHLLRCAEA